MLVIATCYCQIASLSFFLSFFLSPLLSFFLSFSLTVFLILFTHIPQFHHVHHFYSEICDVTTIPKKTITRVMKLAIQALGLKNQPTSADDLVVCVSVVDARELGGWCVCMCVGLCGLCVCVCVCVCAFSFFLFFLLGEGDMFPVPF